MLSFRAKRGISICNLKTPRHAVTELVEVTSDKCGAPVSSWMIFIMLALLLIACNSQVPAKERAGEKVPVAVESVPFQRGHDGERERDQYTHCQPALKVQSRSS